MTKRWSGVVLLMAAVAAFGCTETTGLPGTGGTGGDGGMGGTGGMMDPCADAETRCDDDNECTDDVCDPADGMCSNPAVTDGTSCDFEGLPGVCTAGVCEDAMLCADAGTRCDDENECTMNLCDPLDGECDNPAEEDGTVCEFAPGVGGTCTVGMCEDAMLCADAETRCDDENECTMNLCDLLDGECDNPAEEDGTVCEFAPGVGGTCTAGVCEDAMLCADAGTRCDDENDCTMNLCNPLDGECSNPNEEDGTACDADGNPGICQDGTCVRDCMETLGINADLPTSSTLMLVPSYADETNGFTITPEFGDVSISAFGIGNRSGGGGTASGFEANDRLFIRFFDAMGFPSTASNISVGLSPAGVDGNVVVIVDDGPPSAPIPVSTGGSIVVEATGAHKVDISSPDLDPLRIYWTSLSFDHDCL